MKDLDFGYQQIGVRDAKENKDRITMLRPVRPKALKMQLACVKGLHLRDLADGLAESICLLRWRENTGKQIGKWCRQYIFAAAKRSQEPVSGALRRDTTRKLIGVDNCNPESHEEQAEKSFSRVVPGDPEVDCQVGPGSRAKHLARP